MMTALLISIGWYGAHCPKHPGEDFTTDNASRTLAYAHSHNRARHPRRYRRALRRFIR